MCRSFELRSHEMRGAGEEAYSKQYVTEPTTTQVAASQSYPSGSGGFAARRCCALSHSSTEPVLSEVEGLSVNYARTMLPRARLELRQNCSLRSAQ